MRFDIFTLFPGMFAGPFSESIIKRAVSRDLLTIDLHDIRDYARDEHRTADDYPYGGGSGMVLKPEPVFEAVEDALSRQYGAKDTGRAAPCPIILLTPQGRTFNQAIARDLAGRRHVMLICGHYEGVDERVRERLVNDEISIGDYVLSGGEPAAIVIVDAVSRLVPGVLGSEESAGEDSFAGGVLEYPQYTRPPVYRGWEVPEVLISGNHGRIRRWRREQSLKRTLERRPDLLSKAPLDADDIKYLKTIGAHLPP
ncbi:MAG: tRNA (guanosine(37)-N1)-methyltransferase TrmD [Chloroflexi bacterium]|nr:tRNA (guanosine(37)-N1)-methyltransferase TrmD [Chloroflexota bacterium]